ncbi:hypothetical protein D3C87_1658300 [compost metagenome]
MLIEPSSRWKVPSPISRIRVGTTLTPYFSKPTGLSRTCGSRSSETPALRASFRNCIAVSVMVEVPLSRPMKLTGIEYFAATSREAIRSLSDMDSERNIMPLPIAAASGLSVLGLLSAPSTATRSLCFMLPKTELICWVVCGEAAFLIASAVNA